VMATPERPARRASPAPCPDSPPAEKRPQRARMRAVSELSSVSHPAWDGACQAAMRKGSRPGKWARVMGCGA
jgi:hypothetical protein